MSDQAKYRRAFAAVTLLIASSTLASATLSPVNAATSARKFFAPDYLGQPVAFCLEGAKGCGKPAATIWCRRNGYDMALSYSRRTPVAGDELRFIDTGNICTASNCISFRQIRCVKN
jgi:hypothetical protein